MAKTSKNKNRGGAKRNNRGNNKPFEQHENTGALFENDNKETDSHPDWRGSLTTDDGTKYWVSGWINTPKSGGADYISLKLTPQDEIEEDEEDEEDDRRSKKKAGKQKPYTVDDLPF